MNLETKDIIKQEIEHKLKATSNEIQNYLEKELTNAKEELFNQYLEIERLNNIINEITNNKHDKTSDEEYLKMSKEALVKIINNKNSVISSLDNENKVLKELNVCVGCEDNPTYKTRIDKAIEYIEKNWIEYSDFRYVDNDDELNIDCESIKELFDILKGSDKSE